MEKLGVWVPFTVMVFLWFIAAVEIWYLYIRHEKRERELKEKNNKEKEL